MILTGKSIAIIIGVVVVGGGATGVAIAGEVDWDNWLNFGNHQIDNKYNPFGDRFSVIHTDPAYNEEDGMYYAVTKCEISNRSGQFAIRLDRSVSSYTEVDGGYVVEFNGRAVYFPNAYLDTRTMMVFDSLTPELEDELYETYGVERLDGYHFEVKHWKDRSGEGFGLYFVRDKDQRLIDKDFEFEKVEKTLDLIIVSDVNKVEIQHIDETEEKSLESIHYTEKFFNELCSQCNSIII